MKLSHLLLFILACAVLIISGLTAGSLLALAMLFQINLLINQISLTKISQIAALKLFLFSIPVFFFAGGIQSFVQIYFLEGQWSFLFMAASISVLLSGLIGLQAIISFRYLTEARFQVGTTLQLVFNDIKNKKTQLYKTTGLVFILSFVPWLSTDWKLIFAVLMTQIILNWAQLKPELARPL